MMSGGGLTDYWHGQFKIATEDRDVIRAAASALLDALPTACTGHAGFGAECDCTRSYDDQAKALESLL